MGRVRTHYDNLKVSRNAPIEVIRAAYKALSAKYHPDHNPGSQQAVRAMKIINAAYEVLSDPMRRREHDEWIASMESEIESACPTTPVDPQPHSPPSEPSNTGSGGAGSTIRRGSGRRNLITILAALGGALILGTALGIYLISTGPSNSPTSTTPSVDKHALPLVPASPTTSRRTYVRPTLAPNGQSWPLTSGYLRGNEIGNSNGLCSLTVDNSRNDSDMLVKLVDRQVPKPKPVRIFFLRASEQFILANISAGVYDIRFQNLDSGALSKSEPFNLEETEEPNGRLRYTEMTLTLYTVFNGNTRFERIGPEEF